MCGIFGYWDRHRRPASTATLQDMAARLTHRGPDDEGIHHDRTRAVAVGNRRLSIIDLEGGRQPFLSDDGRIAVVQNGEIFNHVELAADLRREGVRVDTHSDTEVVLRLYEREGIACLKRLNGMFAIAIDDARQDALYLARDRVGIKPLFIHDDGVRLLFGSESKALWPAIESGRPSMDIEALHHFLTFNYVPLPWTIHEGIRHVMPGTWIRVDRSAHLQVNRWWRLADQRIAACGFAEWSEEFLELLDDATRLRLRADVPLGAFLSGGVDSSTIVALMSRHDSMPIRTFCIGFDDARFDESTHACEVASKFGCEHTTEIVKLQMLHSWPTVLRLLDQPHGDASFMPTLRVSELAARHVKVVLTGDGGDELFAGYDKYAAFFSHAGSGDATQDVFERAYFDSISLFTPEAKRSLYRPDVRERLDALDSFDVAARPWLEESRHLDRINQCLYLDMMQLLPGNNLVKPDRMGMAASIEARTPLLDWRVIEFAFRSPGTTKLASCGDKKHWFKRSVAPLINESIAHRRKQMFTVPIGEWFRGELHSWLRDLLHNTDVIGATFLMDHIASMLETHRTGDANWTRQLRALAALAIWYRLETEQ